MSRKPSFDTDLSMSTRLNNSQKLYPSMVYSKKPYKDFQKYSSQVQDRNASQQTHYTTVNYNTQSFSGLRKLPDNISSIRETFSYNPSSTTRKYQRENMNIEREARQQRMKVNDGLRQTLDVKVVKRRDDEGYMERSVSSYCGGHEGLYVKSDTMLESSHSGRRFSRQEEHKNQVKSYSHLTTGYAAEKPLLIEQQIRRLRQYSTTRLGAQRIQPQIEPNNQGYQGYNINIKSHTNLINSNNNTNPNSNQQWRQQNFAKKNYIQYYTPKVEKTQQNDKLLYENNILSPQYIRQKKETSFDVPCHSPRKVTDIKTVKQTIESRTVNKKKTMNQKLTIDHFIIGKSLGQGRFGTAHMAIDKSTGAIFALKKVKKQVIKANNLIDQFILQVKLQSYLTHPFIVKIYGIFDDSEHIYIILEFMQQGTLFNYLKKFKKLQQQDTAEKIRYLAESIKYLQDRGIAHRDIKPQNIIMTNDVCKLADFGWATFCDEQRRKTYCGTCDYVAPQILQGHEYDETVDLWCIGVLTYELMTGKAPFYHMSMKETKKKIINVMLTYPQNFSEHLKSFISGLIQKDPEQRMSIQQVLKHPFVKNIRLSQ